MRDLSRHHLEPAVEIVALDAGHLCRGDVVDSRNHPLRGPILALAAPAGHQVEPLVELLEHVWDLGRVVLAVGIHEHDHLALDAMQSHAERGGLPGVATESYVPDTSLCGHLLPRPVGAAVVHDDDLVAAPHLVENLGSSWQYFREVLALVVRWHQHREARPHRASSPPAPDVREHTDPRTGGRRSAREQAVEKGCRELNPRRLVVGSIERQSSSWSTGIERSIIPYDTSPSHR